VTGGEVVMIVAGVMFAGSAIRAASSGRGFVWGAISVILLVALIRMGFS